MSVNDLVVQGAEPLSSWTILPAASSIPEATAAIVADCRSCRESGCALIGGETRKCGLTRRDYDLEGSRSVRPNAHVAARGDIAVGDAVIGLASSAFIPRISLVARSSRIQTRFQAHAVFAVMTLGGALLTRTGLRQIMPRAIRETGGDQGWPYHRRRVHRQHSRVLPKHLGVGIDLARLPCCVSNGWRAGGIAESNCCALQLRHRHDRIVKPDAIEAVTEFSRKPARPVALLAEVIQPRANIAWSTNRSSRSDMVRP